MHYGTSFAGDRRITGITEITARNLRVADYTYNYSGRFSMNRAALESASSEELVQHFEKAAIVHRELRSAKEANCAFDEAVAIAMELKRRGEEALELLLVLLQSPNPAIRMSAAGLLLPTVPEKAEPVLEQLTDQPQSLGHSAKMTLREWRAGRLKSLI